jgi:flagellar biosynthesis protein FlhG
MTALDQLRPRVLAIGSGKGGVGKSTTSVNLAIIAAKSGRRVGIIDLDPLSNIATILDVPDNRIEAAAQSGATRSDAADGSLASHTVNIFHNLDLLFPAPKLGRGESARLRAGLFDQRAAELLDRYDLLICDMPAGIGREENLAFLPYVGALVIVTNPEPTSHVSAGGYIRVALEIRPDLPILFWHNRHREVLPNGFHPTDVIGNYNRYVDDELRVNADALSSLRHVAIVPDDPSLNLLQQTLSVEAHVLGKLLDGVQMLHKAVIAGIHSGDSLSAESLNELRFYLSSHHGTLVADDLSGEVASVLEGRDGGRARAADFDARAVDSFVRRYSDHPLTRPIREASIAIERAAEVVVDQQSLFATGRADRRPVNLAIVRVRRLLDLVHRKPGSRFEQNLGGVLMCYLAILMICAAPKVRQMISAVIPRRSEAGRTVRDRRLQIRNLVDRDARYHRRYFSLVKGLFPVLVHQINKLVDTTGWSSLLLRDGDGQVNKNAYLKLLTHVLHDSLHAGLGVYVGFRFNSAGRAIEEGAQTLLSAIGSTRRT